MTFSPSRRNRPPQPPSTSPAITRASPLDARNTVWKMLERALPALKTTAAVHVHIDKRLPVQGGIGAGSANAVAALLGPRARTGSPRHRPSAGCRQAPHRRRSRLRRAAVPHRRHGPGYRPRRAGLPPVRTCRSPSASWLCLKSASPPPRPIATGTPSTLVHRASPAASALTPPPASDKLLTLSRALASVLAPRPPEAQSTGDGTHSSGVSAQLLSGAKTLPGSRRSIRFLRLSEPGSKTTSKRSSSGSIPLSEQSGAFLRTPATLRRRPCTRRSPARGRPFSGCTAPKPRPQLPSKGSARPAFDRCGPRPCRATNTGR